MLGNAFFYIVFISQTLVLSYFYPRIFEQRMRYIINTYPPSTHPKLYPFGNPVVAQWRLENALKNYVYANRLMILIGISLITYGIFTQFSPIKINVIALVIAYSMLQFLPHAAMELFAFNQLKLMRVANNNIVRKTVLQQRKLSDFIALFYVHLAVALIFINTAFTAYVTDFNFAWGSKFYIKASSQLIIHVFFAGMILWHLSGKKLNPHQDYKDRITQIGVGIKTAIYGSILGSLFFIAFSTVNHFDIDYLEPILTSIYMQLVAILAYGVILKMCHIKDINFDVYKEETASV